MGDSKRLDPQDPTVVKFFKNCCEVRKPPVGKKFKRIIKVVKRKRVKATTSVGLDFTDEKNKVDKGKFEKFFIRRAKATSGKFSYTKKSSRRRHLAAGSSVTAILEYADDAAAEAGKTAVNGASFGTDLQKDLKADGVDTTVAKSTAVIETVDENVVVEQLVDDEDATTASPTKGAGTTGKGSTKAAGKGSTKAPGKGATKAPGKDATKAP